MVWEGYCGLDSAVVVHHLCCVEGGALLLFIYIVGVSHIVTRLRMAFRA